MPKNTPNTPKDPKYQVKNRRRVHVFCSQCGKEIKVYFMCDRMAIGQVFCDECFDKTDCGQGKHSEDCPTKVICGATQ